MRLKKDVPTQARLKELLHYCPDTGVFTRLVLLCGRGRIGSPVGFADPKGYTIIPIDGMKHRAHRLAWLYVHGEIPAMQIDHINGIRHDNRLSNLRLATNSENCSNARIRSDNTTGYKGVTWHKAIRKWTARIMVRKKHLNLGVFDSPEDAYAAYCAAAKEHHGEFAKAEKRS